MKFALLLDALVVPAASLGLSAYSNAPQQVEARAPDGLGWNLCPLNDVDGDKRSDFAIDDGADSAWVLSGRTAEVLSRLEPPKGSRRAPVHRLQLMPLAADADGDRTWDLMEIGNGLNLPVQFRSGTDLHLIREQFKTGSVYPSLLYQRPHLCDWDGDGFPDLVATANRDGTPGIRVLSGTSEGELLGCFGVEYVRMALLSTGDCDHDGRSEILAADEHVNILLLSRSRDSESSLVWSTVSKATRPRNSLAERMAVSFVPDCDGDERDDVLVVWSDSHVWTNRETERTWRELHPGKGNAIIYSSRSMRPLRTLEDGYADSECDEVCVARLSDVDRDGVPDFAVGYDRWWGEGRLVVYSGRTCAKIREHGGTAKNLDEAGRYGVAIAGMGDADGDAVGDYLVGSSGGVDGVGAGCVSLYSGANGQLLHAIWKRDLAGK